MRLSRFLTDHAEDILREWDAFAATVTHEGKALDKKALRDHAAEILSVIAKDLATPQSAGEQEAKSKGRAEHAPGRSAAETHADFRMMAGFAVDAMITEYRALRASVLKLWTADGGGSTPDDLRDLTRFNEAIDQSIAESVGRYMRQTKKSTDLFLGILGHDIRNPLGTIMMSVEVLIRSGQVSAKAASPILNSAVRINSIIEQVVDFTRAQADGVMPVERTPGNLADQLFKVVQETQVRFPSRTLQLRSAGNFDGSWDEGRIGQLLSNLLGNAFLYGARDGTVTVDLSSTHKEVMFSVHNEGRPIPQDDLVRIFEPMTRGSQSEYGGERREPSGLGLGLYICREIVLAHGGTMQVESTEDEGTTFLVTMPRFAVLAES
ncbi:sensor histidine kinase [Caenimonas aquaedulcis]|uniref:histidine kinase n=1 Tax=Caenimonas aquaedulcis TaxID=2793270 RepID=A0A931MJ58_9BURK|nr:sensor histidine kinase [Caenimonas aquaedulcis]MBG9390559.1 sensor histidine kinase [Caenimonas aquaedulcis]